MFCWPSAARSSTSLSTGGTSENSVHETDGSVWGDPAGGRGVTEHGRLQVEIDGRDCSAPAGCRGRGGTAERYPDRTRVDWHVRWNGQRRNQSAGNRQPSHTKLH